MTCLIFEIKMFVLESLSMNNCSVLHFFSHLQCVYELVRKFDYFMKSRFPCTAPSLLARYSHLLFREYLITLCVGPAPPPFTSFYLNDNSQSAGAAKITSKMVAKPSSSLGFWMFTQGRLLHVNIMHKTL